MGKRFGFSAVEKGKIWSCWKAGQSLHEIGRAFVGGSELVSSIYEVLRAKFKCLRRRLSLFNVCTQDRNRWSPSKVGEPSAAISASLLFSRASCHFFEI
jgi:hypothetical protein